MILTYWIKKEGEGWEQVVKEIKSDVELNEHLDAINHSTDYINNICVSDNE